MKKTYKRFLALILAAFCLTAAAVPVMAGEETEEMVTEAAEEEAVSDEGHMIGALGGWKMAEDITVTDELKEIFDKAAEGLEDVGYEPVAILGTQVIAGMNYCFLCRMMDAPAAYSLVYIYKAPAQDAEIIGARDLDITDFLNRAEDQAPENTMEVDDMIKQAHYLYIDYNFNDETPVNVYYLVNQANELYTIHTLDGAQCGIARYAGAKELLDNSFRFTGENGSLPVEGGKGILVWKNEDGLHAYARNYKDYGDEADIASLGYVESEEEISAMLTR